MNDNIEVKKILEERETSRTIVKEILNFGVTENQKIDIMYDLTLNLEDNEMIKEIAAVLKKYRKNINKDENVSKNDSNDKPKLILDWRR